jgi:hypothetical protein
MTEEKSKSDAMKNYEDNLDQIMAFIEQIKSAGLLKAGKKLQRTLMKEVASAPKISAKRLERAGARFKEAVDKWHAFYQPACRWISVMHVSFLESYFEEGLISIAVRNPSVVKDADIDKRRIFEVDSIEELRGEMRLSWAHNALRPGGPETWRRKLRDLGAPSCDDEAVRKVQHLWDTRNLIVHSQCVVSSAYAKKYADMGVEVGEKVNVNLGMLGYWLPPLKVFMDWSDKFFLDYRKPKEPR